MRANLDLVKHGLVLLPGAMSGIDREKGLVVIKLRVSLTKMKPKMVVLTWKGVWWKVVEASSDTPPPGAVPAFEEIGGVVHTHSTFATAWAQAGKDIPISAPRMPTISAAIFPARKDMTEEEIEGITKGRRAT